MKELSIFHDVIDPIDKNIIKGELTKAKFVRNTSKGGNQIFTFHGLDVPFLMKEVARLREITFRLAGGGTGKALDWDEFDLENFWQLIVWDPKEEKIVGGYRFASMNNLVINKNIHSPAAEIFDFSEKFVHDFAPFTVELGRSFVQPEYQPKMDSRKGIFSLDNLWEGLGSLVNNFDEVKYFFGKVTMYKTYNRQARNLILYFLEKYFPDPDDLVFPKTRFELDVVEREVHLLNNVFIKNSYKEDKLVLQRALAEVREHIPPLFNAYMELSPDMKVFGTANNPFFGDVEETGILVTIESIYPSKKERYIAGHRKD
jgi:hypothetical protein